MEERNIREWLKECPLPAPDKKKKEETRRLLQKELSSRYTSDVEFIWGQLGFIKLHTWLGQLGVLAVICLFVFLLFPYCADYRFYSLISTVTPLLLVFHIEELARVCYKSTLEIEMATKYSLKKLLLSRVFILGITDLCMLGVFVLFLNGQFKVGIFTVMLYCLVPFLITVAGLLYLLKFAGQRLYGYQAFAYTIFVCLCFVILPHYKPAMYGDGSQGYWIVAAAAALGVLVWVARDTWKKLDCVEGLLTV